MNSQIALEYIPHRMKDLGFDKRYYIRFRHFVIKPSETFELDAHNQFYILVEEIPDMTILSDMGIYDLSYPYINEQVYEHQGSITITNHSQQKNHIRFIQVIPITY